MIQLNLLPDVKKDYLKAQRMKRNILALSVVISIAVTALVLLLALYVHGAQRLARNQLQNDIDKTSKEVQNQPDVSKILTVQGALASLPGLHEQEHLNSRFFEYLKVVVPKEVSLEKVEINHTDNIVKISGKSADYKSLNVFADMLKNAQVAYGPQDQRTTVSAFNKVTINTASQSTNDVQKAGNIDFTMSLEFAPIIFESKAQNPVMTVPTVTTSQGVVQSNQVFGNGEGGAQR